MTKPPFDDVVAAHATTVLRVCRAVLGPVDADDAWSETFLAALRAYPGLPADANVEAWLVTIAHRKAIDVHRGRSRRAVPVAEPPDGVHRDPDPAAWADELWPALAALPFKQRATVAYHYLVGLPYAEITAIVGGSPAAARRAGSDGIAALRAALADRPCDVGATR